MAAENERINGRCGKGVIEWLRIGRNRLQDGVRVIRIPSCKCCKNLVVYISHLHYNKSVLNARY